MLSKALLAVAAILFAVPQIALSQDVSQPSAPTQPQATSQAEMPTAQLLAGVRAYPPGVVAALIKVSEHPNVLRQLAENPQRLMNPDTITPPVSPELKAAIRELQQLPEAVPLAAAYPEDMAQLRKLYQSSPQEVEERLNELRARYYAARLQGNQAWQQALSQNPTALEEYQNLVTQFTREQLKQYPQFPYVVVTQPLYYEAAPPNELIMAYAQDRHIGEPLRSMMNNWWAAHGLTAMDRQALLHTGPTAPVSAESLASLPAKHRSDMWHAASGPAGAAAALMPVIMQPFADQPLDARLAYAVAENARLWGEPLETLQPPIAAAPEGIVTPPGEPYVPEGEYVLPEGEAELPSYPEEFAQQYPEYEYGYQPEYAYPPTAEYYSPLVPYYYSYPWIWPVAYSYYPSLYSYWPYAYYYPYAGGAYFAFNFGYGPHYYHYRHHPRFFGRFGRFTPYHRFYANRYYGRGFYGHGLYANRYYGHAFYGGRGLYAGRGFYGNRFYAGRGAPGFHVGRRGAGGFYGGRVYGGRSAFGGRAFRGERFGLAGHRTVTRGAIGRAPRVGGFYGRAGHALGPVRGGAFRGPAVRGGAFRGPAVRGGAFRGPAVRGGSFRSGALRGGGIRGGAFHAGGIRGGAFHGGMRGGAFHGGMRGGGRAGGHGGGRR